ncbi:MAG: chromosomal replication initiator protein DnaA [Proteobacteria bacterium]|nr:chromosomal replication initiator protein DnaA [Pseudomonadota bacterium]
MLEKGNIAAIQKNSAVGISSHANIDASWQEIRSLLHKEFGGAAFKSWIAPIKPQSFNNGVLELAVATRFMRDWVKTHYADRIRQLWAQYHGVVARVDVVIAAPSAEKTAPFTSESAVETLPTPDNISSPLDVRFTFDNFVVGKPNELAHAAARRVADSDTVAFNPLFLYGGVGLGKTHLMHAIAWTIRARTPRRKVVYMSAEKFMYQFVRALRFKDTMSFKEQFRSVDVLMIDDIQFICGKESTQEEFFHTFNALIDQNKQIIISADKSPSDLDGLEERLRSRLGWGLVADIHPTTYELRLGILEQKRDMLKREIPQNVLEFLAHKISSNIRELEGALNRIIAHSELTGRPVTIDGAQDLLQDLLRANDRRASVEDIQRKVAEHYNIRISDMHSPRRARMVARPRQIAMYLAKALTEHSLPEIGRKFGGRDHTTIMHGVRRIEEFLLTDRSLKEEVDLLKRAIGG